MAKTAPTEDSPAGDESREDEGEDVVCKSLLQDQEFKPSESPPSGDREQKLKNLKNLDKRYIPPPRTISSISDDDGDQKRESAVRKSRRPKPAIKTPPPLSSSSQPTILPFPAAVDIRQLGSIHSHQAAAMSHFGGSFRTLPLNGGASVGATTAQQQLSEETWNIGDPLHDDTLILGRWRNRCGKFTNSIPVQIVVTTLIAINALILGALTYPCVDDDYTRCDVLEKTDLTILVVFTLELALQMFYLSPFKFLRQGWLVFDFVIVLLSWLFMDSTASIFRSLRIFRLFALFSRYKSLRNLVQAVGRTLPKMATIWTALLLFFYTFSVLYTNLYSDLFDKGYLDYDYFGRLDRTFLTLFQFMTLDSWTHVVRQVIDANPYALIGFIFWVIVTAFFVLNLVIAVICESLIELNNLNEEKRQNKMMKHHRHLITEQTQQLIEETENISLLQRELLANQVAMQQLLLGIATQLQVGGTLPPGDDDAIDLQSIGKGKLAELIQRDQQVDEDDYSNTPKRLYRDFDSSGGSTNGAVR